MVGSIVGLVNGSEVGSVVRSIIGTIVDSIVGDDSIYALIMHAIVIIASATNQIRKHCIMTFTS